MVITLCNCIADVLYENQKNIFFLSKFINFFIYFAFYVYGPTIRNCVVGHCLVNMTAVVKVVIHCVLILHYYKRNTLAIIIHTIIILIDSVPHLCLWRLLILWSTDRVLGRSLCEMSENVPLDMYFLYYKVLAL